MCGKLQEMYEAREVEFLQPPKGRIVTYSGLGSYRLLHSSYFKNILLGVSSLTQNEAASLNMYITFNSITRVFKTQRPAYHRRLAISPQTAPIVGNTPRI